MLLLPWCWCAQELRLSCGKLEAQAAQQRTALSGLQAQASELQAAARDAAQKAEAQRIERERMQRELSAVAAELRAAEQELIERRREVEGVNGCEAEARHRLQMAQAELRAVEEGVTQVRGNAWAGRMRSVGELGLEVGLG